MKYVFDLCHSWIYFEAAKFWKCHLTYQPKLFQEDYIMTKNPKINAGNWKLQFVAPLCGKIASFPPCISPFFMYEGPLTTPPRSETKLRTTQSKGHKSEVVPFCVDIIPSSWCWFRWNNCHLKHDTLLCFIEFLYDDFFVW